MGVNRRRLEDLVPPLELCQRIPAGAFADSALVWVVVGDGSGGERWYLVERKNVGETKYPEIHPAPTLAEILAAFRNEGVVYPTAAFANQAFKWLVLCGESGDDFAFDDENVTTAALKLWLELNERKEENA